MKILLPILLLISTCLQSQERNITARDAAILIDAEVTTGLQTTVTLKWNKNEQARAYGIFKKEIGTRFPQNATIILDSNSTSWVDDNVVEGKIYEYKIIGDSYGRLRYLNEMVDTTYLAHGYKAVSVNAPAYTGGRLLILIDSTVREPLANEIARYEDDILKEGWTYVTRYVTRSEEFDGDKVKEVKQIILEEFNKQQFNHIFILGRVPVPYSGNIVPDGHTNNHYGAWPADIYYGSMDEYLWTDSQVNSTSAPDRTKNIPGDGKFDQSNLYNQNLQTAIPTHAAVGRVDFYNMPAFEKSEIELLRLYLDKDHKFRTGQIKVENKALIDNNFAAHSIPASFAWSGWANFASIVGKDNVVVGDWIKNTSEENLQDKTYLMAFGDGAGSYKSASGVGTTANFAQTNLNAVFTILFGSYFGDWDVSDNLMRAALASEPSVLTCSWSGRPHWYYHHLGLDYPIGFSTNVTLNNTTDYLPILLVINGQLTFPEGFLLQVHTSLLGDPTLKVNPAPVLDYLENLSAVQEGVDTKLTWDMPENGVNKKWDIFYTVDKSDIWSKANSTPVTTNEFLDDFKYNGEITYMVRELIEEDPISPSVHGKLQKYSRGNLTTITRSDVNSVETITSDIELRLSPNPAVENVNINFKTNLGDAKILIYNLQGEKIQEFNYSNVGNSINQLNWNLKGKNGKLNSGIYFIQFVNNNQSITEKLIIK